jgi:hypothetical protein
MLPAAGYNPITAATTTMCNGPYPVGVVDVKVDRGRRRGLDSDFRFCSTLDDATTNAVDQMDPWRILRVGAAPGGERSPQGWHDGGSRRRRQRV